MSSATKIWIVTLLHGIAACFLCGEARADQCAAEAQKVLPTLCGNNKGATLTPDVAKIDPAATVSPYACPSGGGPTLRVVFQKLTKAERKATPPEPKDLADPSKKDWQAAAGGCPDLVYAVYASASSAPPPGNTLNSPPKRVAAYEALHKIPVESTTEAASKDDRAPRSPEHARAIIKSYRGVVSTEKAGVVAAVPGQATGFEAVAGEAIHILGQIVATRASNQAYALLKDKLVELLECHDDLSSKRGFNQTCSVLKPLRMQDIAASRDALLAALVKDTWGQIMADRWMSKIKEAAPLLQGVLAGSVIPLVTRPNLATDTSAVRAILSAILSQASAISKEFTPSEKVLVVAVAAYLQCITSETGQDDPIKRLAACDIGANVDQLAGGSKDILTAAHALANELVVIATPVEGEGTRVRMIHAINTVFNLSCMLVRNGTGEQGLACTMPTTIAKAEDALALAQPIVVDAYNRETNDMIASVVYALQVLVSDAARAKPGKPEDVEAAAKAAAETAGKKYQRIFSLLGGLLNYAATYYPKSQDGASTPPADAHEQRTKILESLTETMTDRTGRDGDTIWSLGGALRGAAGVRLADGHKAFYGPVSLPLGAHLTHIAESGPGFHLQLDALDLGEYLAFDKEVKVATPKAANVLSPSLTIGLAWGRSMPFVLGLTGGYSPQVVLDPDQPNTKGSINVGVTAGIQVPLFDLN